MHYLIFNFSFIHDIVYSYTTQQCIIYKHTAFTVSDINRATVVKINTNLFFIIVSIPMPNFLGIVEYLTPKRTLQHT